MKQFKKRNNKGKLHVTIKVIVRTELNQFLGQGKCNYRKSKGNRFYLLWINQAGR